jgi:Peptidase M61 N-terminal domain
MVRRFCLPLCSIVAALGFAVMPQAASSQPAGTAPILLQVDASNAVQGVVRVHETVPVTGGALTLVYPKWIPGTHGPNGPIASLGGLTIRANGAVLPWKRDLVDLYAFHVDVPAGTNALDVSFAYLAATSGGSRLASPSSCR